ncbi:MAG TPA: hypothetical protein VI776_17330, partial [Anaerolineales bacterium]|nr:hypothetical protein [Anaerolineales bacterium]
MDQKMTKPFLWLAALVILVSLACGVGGGGGSDIEQTQPAATQAPEEPQVTVAPQATEVVESGAISDLEDARNAVIQIESQGTFVNPDSSVSYNTAGYGSGFIIDPSGIAV